MARRESNEDGQRMNRREALKLGAAAATLGHPMVARVSRAGDVAIPPRPGSPGYVIKVHMPGMRGNRFPHADAARKMVDEAVCRLTGERDASRAFGHFVTPEDRVGLKINVVGGRMASTMKEVTDAVVDGVRAAGVPDGQIMIFDQFGGNMKGARYLWQERPGILRTLNHDAIGYEREWLRSPGGGRAKLSKALSWATAIINLPVLKDHDLAGVTCTMKNMVFGCVEKPHLMHQDIHTALPHFYAMEEIRGKVRVHIVDGSFCLYDGGPHYKGSAHTTHDSVYATTDPVAMDTIALEVVETLRAANGFKSLAEVGRPATYLKLAEKLGLGIGERRRIYLDTIDLPPYTGPTS